MDDRMRTLAAGAAYHVLESVKRAHLQWTDDKTPLDELTPWLGLEVSTFHPDDYPQGTYGFLDPGENLVGLRRDLPETLRRFTLAHELGHAILHRQIGYRHITFNPPQPGQESEQGMSREDPCQTQDVREEAMGFIYQEQAEELLGIGLSYDPRSQRELEANIFAAELLMPLERIRALYLTKQLPANKLAGVFDVSNAAMLNRVAGLLVETRETPGQGEVEQTGGASPPKKQYDEFQQAAIETPTPALVVAGPGSGKTSTLIGRAEYLLRNQGVRPEQILALTFSRKAAQEMQERLQKILPAGQLAPTISTFHAFCADLLRTHGPRVGLRQDFALVDDAEGYFLFQSLAGSLPLKHYHNLFNPASPFRDFLKAISRAKDELITQARYRELAATMQTQADSAEERQTAERALEVAAVYKQYQRSLEQRGDSDFGGLLMPAAEL